MTDTKIAVKAFDKNFQCKGYQFEVGETYQHAGKIEICKSGFHACENPMDIFNYYPLDSRFAEVELIGETQIHNEDSKVVAASIPHAATK